MSESSKAMRKFLDTVAKVRLTKKERDGIVTTANGAIAAFGTEEFNRGKQAGIEAEQNKKERNSNEIRIELLDAVTKALGLDR